MWKITFAAILLVSPVWADEWTAPSAPLFPKQRSPLLPSPREPGPDIDLGAPWTLNGIRVPEWTVDGNGCLYSVICFNGDGKSHLDGVHIDVGDRTLTVHPDSHIINIRFKGCLIYDPPDAKPEIVNSVFECEKLS